MHPDYRKVTLVHLLSHRAGTPSMTHDINPFTEEEHNHLKNYQTVHIPAEMGHGETLKPPTDQ